jgi:uncharacterized protein
LLVATAAVGLDVPPSPTRWVTDVATILSPAAAKSLDEYLERLEKKTGAQFIVYTLPSLQGDTLEEFTLRAANAWGVGRKGHDDGLVLFIFRDDHKVRIEVGLGLETTIPDSYARRVIREEMTPRFRKGDFDGGITAAVKRLAKRIQAGRK